MYLKEVVEPGDKIKIYLVQPVVQHLDDEEDKNQIEYKSEILDITDGGKIEVAIPTLKNKAILFPFNVMFNFVFFTKKGIYQCKVEIIDRYRIQNLSFMAINEKSEVIKIQRREYYRLSCTLDMKYYLLTPEESKMDSIGEIFESLKEDGGERLKEKEAVIVDISGGGMRYVSKEQVGRENFILARLNLVTDKADTQLYVIAKVIASARSKNNEEIFEHRIRFIIKDDKVREAIIHYIFDEQRRTRNKENG